MPHPVADPHGKTAHIQRSVGTAATKLTCTQICTRSDGKRAQAVEGVPWDKLQILQLLSKDAVTATALA